ncbi:hypothetical protein D3C85_523680 [compost metagenome]
MVLQPLGSFIADRTGGRQNATRHGTVAEKRIAIILHLKRLTGGPRGGIQGRYPDQGVEQAIHPVVDHFTRRNGNAFRYFV